MLHSKLRVCPPPVVHKHHDLTSSLGPRLTTNEPDVIMGTYDIGEPHFKMSCGHVFDPNSLTEWCRSLVTAGSESGSAVILYCPAIVDGKFKQCRKEWEYPEVLRAALLTADERKYFEIRLSGNVLSKECEAKECPGCHTFVERGNTDNLRVHCDLCTKKKGRCYDFCWYCRNEWSGPNTASVKCGNPNCQHPEMPSIRDAPMFTLNGEQVPLRRACPTCGKVVEHKQEGCKMIICPRCENEYCFMCLELKNVCLKNSPRSWYGKCSKPVAPRQTSIPMQVRSCPQSNAAPVVEPPNDFLQILQHLQDHPHLHSRRHSPATEPAPHLNTGLRLRPEGIHTRNGRSRRSNPPSTQDPSLNLSTMSTSSAEQSPASMAQTLAFAEQLPMHPTLRMSEQMPAPRMPQTPEQMPAPRMPQTPEQMPAPRMPQTPHQMPAPRMPQTPEQMPAPRMPTSKSTNDSVDCLIL